MNIEGFTCFTLLGARLASKKNCSMPMPLANCVLELSGYINFFHYNRTGCHCIANVCPVPNSFVKCL